ncbi:hypothetical protein TanjilG_11411 [Lupinus angustifolius]|uniref:Uncharacterized protein n=1 Tax=Lupinus angustifolius TaxID=3871 RepID=A0A1J7I602_LUPAN|nr:PREDICTED: uncharacterized protein LOC109344796 [Lupinus angustifolius]OIW14066.1 hypothetical protein TanjilG_11411 [Lupinus angustifolius]
METIKHKSAINNGSNRLVKTFHKVISFRNVTKIASNNDTEYPFTQRLKTHQANDKDKETKARHRAVMEALIARLFSGVATIKASYAELQIAQNPYDNEAIQKADQAVVYELRAISCLKQCFLKKELNLSPPVTLMLAEIQEQQSQMEIYQITIKKLEAQVDVKESEISFLTNKHSECIAFNKSLEKKLHSSRSLLMFENENLHFSALKPTHFINFLHHTLISMKCFVKLMIREMELAHWNLEAALNSIHHDAVLSKQSHQFFAFKSFVCMKMFEGFNNPSFSSESSLEKHNNHFEFEEFMKFKSLNPKQYVSQNPNSSFARFLKSKYLEVVHAKMECSFSGSLNQKKLVNGGFVPDSEFFMAFADLAKRVWCLHCLALSFEEYVTIFQVKKNSRFSEVYMDCAAVEELVSKSGEAADSDSGELRVGFTVVPGFLIGKTVIQSEVYLSPVSC